MPAPHRPRRLTAFLMTMALLIVTPLAVVAASPFDDVPDSNIFHDDITWLADADVTRGCNPPDNDEFCPEDNVTRQQMAAFMKRLAENQVVDAATAVTAENAEALGGAPSSAYQTIIQADFCQLGDCTNSTGSVIPHLTIEVDAPADGVLQIASSLHVFGDGAGAEDFVQMWAAVDQTANNGCGGWLFAPTQNAEGSYAAVTALDDDAASVSTTTAVAVPAGIHTVRLCSLSLQNTETGTASLTTVWSATGDGLEPAAAALSESKAAELAPQFEGYDLSHLEG